MTEGEQRAIGRIEGTLNQLVDRIDDIDKSAADHRARIDAKLNPIHDNLLGGSRPLLPRLGNMADAYDRAGWLGKLLAVTAPVIAGAVGWWLGALDWISANFNSQ